VRRREFLRTVAFSTCLLQTIKAEKIDSTNEIKTAILYRNLADGRPEWRTVEDAVNIIADLKPDFIWMIYEKGIVCPAENEDTAYDQAYEALITAEFPEEKAREIASDYAQGVKERCYHFDCWKYQTTLLKQKLDVTVSSAIFTQGIPYWGWHFETLEPYTQEEIRSMALNLADYGLKDWDFERTQKFFQKYTGFNVYYPDYCNEDYQEWLLSCIKRMKDCGADAVWLDMFFSQATLTYRDIIRDFNHPAVKKPFEACCDLIDRIKRKYGLMVGSWSGSYVLLYLGADKYNYPTPNFDFITENPDAREVLSMNFDDDKWGKIFTAIRRYNPNVTILITPDWGPWDNTMLAVFSQELTQEQQCQYLRIWNNFARKHEAVPCFPVHGGDLGPNAKKLAWGKYPIYDALAPEFNTYNCIKKLIQESQIITTVAPQKRIPGFTILNLIMGLIIVILLKKILQSKKN